MTKPIQELNYLKLGSDGCPELIQAIETVEEYIIHLETTIKNTLRGWKNIKEEKPPKCQSIYYRERFSYPVLVQCDVPRILRWDYKDNGWVDQFYTDGCSAKDYDFAFGDKWTNI